MRVEPMKVLRPEIAEYKEVVIRSIEKIKYRFKHVPCAIVWVYASVGEVIFP